MPIYEYKCPNGHLLEVFHGMTEPGPDRCDICGEEPLQRVLHPVAVHYKGSGFYSTDYGRGARKPGGGSSESSSGDGGSSGDSGSSGEGTTPKEGGSSSEKKVAEA